MSASTSQLETYVRQVGESIRTIYTRLNDISRRLEEIDAKINETRAELRSNANAVSDLKESTVPKAEFDDFVNRLTESLRELIPPVTTGTEETKKEEQ